MIESTRHAEHDPLFQLLKGTKWIRLISWSKVLWYFWVFLLLYPCLLAIGSESTVNPFFRLCMNQYSTIPIPSQYLPMQIPNLACKFKLIHNLTKIKHFSSSVKFDSPWRDHKIMHYKQHCQLQITKNSGLFKFCYSKCYRGTIATIWQNYELNSISHNNNN